MACRATRSGRRALAGGRERVRGRPSGRQPCGRCARVAPSVAILHQHVPRMAVDEAPSRGAHEPRHRAARGARDVGAIVGAPVAPPAGGFLWPTSETASTRWPRSPICWATRRSAPSTGPSSAGPV